MSERLYALLTRIAVALEAQQEPEDDTLTFPLSDFSAFAWTKIGATIVDRDSDGVSIIRTANGKMAKRRSNDKFGTEIWFSYADGKAPDGTNKYRKVVEFRNVAPPEPLGRKTEQAVKAATIIESPLMGPIRKRWADLSAEYLLVNKTEPIPERFNLSPALAVPENQHRTDEFAQFVAGLKMMAADHAPAQGAEHRPALEDAREWYRTSPRISADNRGAVMEELQGHLRKLPACKLDLAKLSPQARMDAFGEWLKSQAVQA